MDPTKQPLGVVTMAYQDYFFLERWYDYYSDQVGSENLFLFSHGNDPKHRRIAKNANVMNLPRDPSMLKFDRRRWRTMSFTASGLLDSYNWMIVSDVDEIVIVDPDAAPSLVDYITAHYSATDAPRNISPLCLEMVHLPDDEPDPIRKGDTILSKRRSFRPNRNYSKPNLIGAPGIFGPGGHRNNLGKRHLPDDLYTLHLKFFDRKTLRATASARQKIVKNAKAAGENVNEDHQWNKTLEAYETILATTTFAGEDIALPEFRAEMRKQTQKYTDQWLWGPVTTDKLYRIPERFAPVF